MRNFITAVALLIGLCNPLYGYQQKDASTGWTTVTELPTNAQLKIDHTYDRSLSGRFQVANERRLVVLAAGRMIEIDRTTVRTIRWTRGNKAGVGALVGLGTGAATMLIINSSWADAEHPAIVLAGSGIGAGIGALVGLLFKDSETLYEFTTGR